jgi:hypothetical protein
MQDFKQNAEIIAAFFTDRCYNAIYVIAKDYFTKNACRSLTEVYTNMLAAHLREIAGAHTGADGILRETIAGLHTYYCGYLGQISLEDFIGRVIAQIVPEEFFSTMSQRERDSMLRDLAKQTILSVGQRALQPDMLHRIIDMRADHVGVTILRDAGIAVLRDFKASFMSKLYSKQVASACKSRVVAYEIYDKLRAELRNAVEVGVSLEQQHKKDIATITKLETTIARLQRAVSSARSYSNVANEASIARVEALQIPSCPSVAARTGEILAIPTMELPSERARIEETPEIPARARIEETLAIPNDPQKATIEDAPGDDFAHDDDQQEVINVAEIAREIAAQNSQK